MPAPVLQTPAPGPNHRCFQGKRRRKLAKATPGQLREVVANSLNDMGTALARKHDYAAAVLPFHYAAEDDPALDPVMRNLGFAAFLSGSYKESEKALRQEIATHPDDATARAYLGMALFETGEYSEASATFQFFGSALVVQSRWSKPPRPRHSPVQGQRAQVSRHAGGPQHRLPLTRRCRLARPSHGSILAMSDAPPILPGPRCPGIRKLPDALRVVGEIALERGDGPGAVRAFDSELKGSQIVNAAFVLGDAEQLPFPASTFDLVSCQCSFHHMPKPQLVLREMVRVAKPEGRLVIVDPLAPESDAKNEIYNRIERLRDPSHTLTLRLTDFLRFFDEEGLETLRQSLRRRPRSFNNWMLRGGHAAGTKKYLETRKLMEDSMAGDRAGFSAQAQVEDIQIVHNEGMFLLGKKGGTVDG